MSIKMFEIIISGGLIGLILGLIGGGGSILAVPLLLYVVKLTPVHFSFGTAALVVAVAAAFNLMLYARDKKVKWRCGLVFSAFGIVGAFGGSMLGKMTDGHRLLFLFGILMVSVGLFSFFKKEEGENQDIKLTQENAVNMGGKLGVSGVFVGFLSGFFGIGGGFLIVPALIFTTKMPMVYAIGTSLIAVMTFGLTTAFTYALSDLVAWKVAGIMIIAASFGGLIGKALSQKLSHTGLLKAVFAAIVIVTGIYISYSSL
jgi:uncharacterized protein